MVGVNTSNTNAASKRGISGFDLKLIAVMSMFIDHFAAVVLWSIINASYGIGGIMQVQDGLMDRVLLWVANNREFVWTIYEVFRLIGRIAFPIYCFLIVEGFAHTKNVGKYALRLGIFALVSEIPFDLAFNDTWWDLSYNNVFFTLVIGLLVIWGISYVLKFYKAWMEKKLDKFLGSLFAIGAGVILVAGGSYIAEYMLCTDYGAAGVVTIVVMYLLRQVPWFGFAMGVMTLTIMCSSTEIVALLGLVPLFRYTGERGTNIKYFFYAFYPVHLLLLWFLTVILGV